MDNAIITALIGSTGISLGAFFGGLGYYLKTNAERTKYKKLVLFHLLEFRYQVKSSYVDPKDLSDEYFRICASYFEKIGLGDKVEIPESIKVQIEEFMGGVVGAIRPNIDENFIQSFEVSLKNLCQIDPILAFKLRGRERLSELIAAQKKYLTNLNESASFDAPLQINEYVFSRARRYSKESIGELLKDVDEDIFKVARACGIMTWLGCKSVIKKQSKQAINFENLGIEDLLEKLMIELLHEVKKYNDKFPSNAVNFV